MKVKEKEDHWNDIHSTRPLETYSWYQFKPEISLELIHELNPESNARIIDIGGGDSFLVDYLFSEGYSNITVVDISEKALDKVRERISTQGHLAKLILADIAVFQPEKQYDIWHDRAAFHFLTDKEDIKHYVKAASNAVVPGGYLVIGSFSDTGPEKCSGLTVSRYKPQELGEIFSGSFNKIQCFRKDHITPRNSVQNFSFCVLQRKTHTDSE